VSIKCPRESASANPSLIVLATENADVSLKVEEGKNRGVSTSIMLESKES
jgi:hypothetical protein